MKTDITIEKVIESAERCAGLGISVVFPFIVGFPGESEASVDATMALAVRLRNMPRRFATPIFNY